MKVSVSMITFNHEPYIAQAIESVLAQDVGDEVELVIGEDCSTDGTRAIVEAYAARHPRRVRLLPSERRLGIMPNWMRTLAACRGEYLAVLDGDDFWTSPRKLGRQLELLEAQPDLQLSLHVCREVYEDGSREPHPSPAQHRPRYGMPDLIRGPIGNSSTLLCRRRVIDELPACFVEVPVGDWGLQVLSALHGDVGFLDEEMSQHRNHGGGTFAGGNRARQRQMLIDTRRLLAPLLPPQHAALARQAEFHDIFQQGRAYERLGQHREAIGCYTWCREHLDDAGKTTRWQVRKRLLRAQALSLLGGKRGTAAPRAELSESSG